MEKLRTTLKQYRRWTGYEIYVERITAAVEPDFSLALENAKALLEGIGKEICTAKGHELGVNPTMNDVLKSSFCCLGYSNNEMVNQISRSLANIGQEIGKLRNDVGSTAHGRSLEELQERNDKVDLLTREFLLDTISSICVFLIRVFEGETSRVTDEPLVDPVQPYETEQEFNDYWDDLYGDVEMGDYSFAASEVFYSVDYNDYLKECAAYKSEPKEEEANE